LSPLDLNGRKETPSKTTKIFRIKKSKDGKLTVTRKINDQNQEKDKRIGRLVT